MFQILDNILLSYNSGQNYGNYLTSEHVDYYENEPNYWYENQ